MNKQKLNKIFAQHHHLIVRAVRAQQPNINGVTAEDVEQEVCIRLFKVLKDDREIENLPSYIYRITSNAIIDLVRKNKRHLHETSMPVESDEDDYRPELISEDLEPDQKMLDKETEGQILAAIESLPESRRVAVKMRLQGFSIKEMCEMTGWSFYKAENLSKRSMAALKDKLKEMNSDYEIN